MSALPTETIAVRLHQYLPKKSPEWTEELLRKHLTIEKVAIPSLQQGQVLVRMERAPINPVDLLIMSQNYCQPASEVPLPFTPGYEGNGTVIAQGGGFEGLLDKRVAVLGNYGQGRSEYAVLSGATCVPLQDDVTWEEGSSVFINPLSVIGMIKIAKDRGLKSIVHTAAASALGKMLIKYGKSQGVDIICVVRKDSQVKECKDAGATHVLNLNDKEFDEKLKQIAEKENATLAYEAVAGELTGRILAALPYGSEVQVYGTLSVENVGGISFKSLTFEKKSVSGYWLAEQLKDPSFGAFAFPQVSKLLKGELATKISKTFALEDIHKAIIYYIGHMTEGKSLIDLSHSRRS